MFVIPNFGVEYRIGANPYRYMTLGLTGKYNWNTSHVSGSGSAYSPSLVYDLLDIRLEYRYYFRLREGKKAKAWQALYTGAYANYADYIFKLGKYGLRVHSLISVFVEPRFSLVPYSAPNDDHDLPGDNRNYFDGLLNFNIGFDIHIPSRR